MKDNDSGGPTPSDWGELEAKIDQLIARNGVLVRENEALRRQVQSWSVEHAALVRKNELAQAGLEALITRYKLLERG